MTEQQEQQPSTPPEPTLADLFVPYYGPMWEYGPNGEKFVATGVRIPAGFVLFLALMVAWGVKALF